MAAKNEDHIYPGGWHFDSSYTRLPLIFYARTRPEPVSAPRIVALNRPLAQSLGLNIDMLEQSASILSGNEIPPGAEPIAQAYAGHQFGHFTNLGDGRAILYGEQITPNGARFDIQLKGAGITPFSRRGDGRAALGPMLREYAISEAMHALGVPTSRSLAVLTTGDTVFRESAHPGALLVRVAASHIRIGTFEYARSQGNYEHLKSLADYVIERHYPNLTTTENPYVALLESLIDRQAALVARWLLVGFIHGVMNTDNMTLSGETIDYGPCAFMEDYNPSTVFSSIDRHGRYAYGNQPHIAQWNLARFAETLLPLIHNDQGKALTMAQGAIESFPTIFKNYWLSGMREKLGLLTEEKDDGSLIEELLEWMQKNQADFTNTFRTLPSVEISDEAIFRNEEFKQWHGRWKVRLNRQPQSIEVSINSMRTRNPAFIPRNHRVEEALSAAEMKGDFSTFNRLLDVLRRPYEDQPENSSYQKPALSNERISQTFCGT